MFQTPELKVGMLVIVLGTIIGGMSLKLSQGVGFLGGTKQVHFMVEDAGGLVKNSGVRMAGIKVGAIKDIKLVEGLAKVTLEIESEVPIYKTATVALRSDGILGDKHVDLNPGNIKDGEIDEAGQINKVLKTGSMSDVMNKVGAIAHSLEGMAKTLTKAIQGDGDGTTPIGRVILNIEKISKDLSEITGANKDKINTIVSRIESVAVTIDELVNDSSDEGLRTAWGDAVASLRRIDTSLKNIEEVTDKINRGEGTIGKLVNDEQTVDELNAAIGNVNKFFGGASNLETSIDYHTEFQSSNSKFKNYLGFRLQPGLDRYYELQVIADPSGVTSTRDFSTTTGGTTTTRTESVTNTKDLKFSLLFAKNFYDFTIKGGVMESFGGIGFDYYFLRRKIRLSLEAFNFSNLNTRAFLRYNFTRGIYITGGTSNIKGSSEDNSFFGAGLLLTNDDLKVLAAQVGF